jgi:hypothetical protein
MLRPIASRHTGEVMGFGKQSGGSTDSLRQLVQPTSPPKVAKSGGGFDAAFIALALGVVTVSAGGAIAAPSIVSWVQTDLFESGTARSIETVIAGLDRDGAKAALAKEAFPDKQGREFMASLAAKFPEDHDKLLGKLADAAMKGADRDGLMLAISEWTMEFAPGKFAAIGRTGADGFDKVLAIAADALNLLESAGEGRCNLEALQSLANNPASLAELSAYGSVGYKFNMRASRMLIELSAAGSNAPEPDAVLRPEDEQALQSAFMSMMRDPQVMSLMRMPMTQTSSPGQRMQGNPAANLNICALGRTAIGKLKGLPSGTKSRLFGMALSQAMSLKPSS